MSAIWAESGGLLGLGHDENCRAVLAFVDAPTSADAPVEFAAVPKEANGATARTGQIEPFGMGVQRYARR